MAGLLTRKAQVALKIEATEGTAVTLGATSAHMLVYDPVFTPNIDRFVRNPARSKLTPLGAITGKRAAALAWKTELKGSGSLTTVPAWDVAIRICGFTRQTVSGLTVGAITGTFYPGETVTGSSSGATGRIVGEWTGADGEVRIVALDTSTPFNTDDRIVGGTSGASADVSQTIRTDQGFEYRPVSESVPSASAALYMDGLRKALKGCRGTVSIEAVVGEPVVLNFQISGSYDGVTDAALLSGIDYEDNDPIAFLNVGASVGGLSACFANCNIDIANNVAVRECARATYGIKSFLITSREPMASLDPEMELVATHDFYGRLLAQTTGRLYYELPSSTAGEKVVVACPRIQYTNIGEGDREGIAVADLDLALISASVDSGDDELQIAVI